MIIVMEHGASDEAIERVSREIEKMGGTPHLSRGKFKTVIGAVGESAPFVLSCAATTLAALITVGLSRPVRARQPA